MKTIIDLVIEYNSEGLKTKYVIFFIQDGIIKYLDDEEFNDLEPYFGTEEIDKALIYEVAEQAIDVVRGFAVSGFYVRAISTGYANNRII